MLIDFKTMETSSIPHFKGGEGHLDAKMFLDDHNRILCATLKKGSTVGLHTHEINSEVIFVIAGEANHVCDGVVEHIVPGQCCYCPKGSSHELITTSEEPLQFYAVVGVH